jgi:hypothetical protein
MELAFLTLRIESGSVKRDRVFSRFGFGNGFDILKLVPIIVGARNFLKSCNPQEHPASALAFVYKGCVRSGLYLLPGMLLHISECSERCRRR